MRDEIIAALLIAVGTVAGMLLQKFFSSYATEKGKNLATREDMGRITAEIENVKAAIQTIGQLTADYEKQRRQLLLSFYDTSVEMIHERIAVSFGDIPFDEGKSLFAYQQSFAATVVTMLREYQRIVLYFQHEDAVRVHAEAVLQAALQAQKIVKARFGQIKISVLAEEAAYKAHDDQRYKQAAADADKANKAFWDDMHPVAETFQKALRTYLTAVNKFMRDGIQKGGAPGGNEARHG